jgi:hypothetical protein
MRIDKLKLALFILWMLICSSYLIGQTYRVRAVTGLFYVPDTIAHGDILKCYSPYLDRILFKVETMQGYPVTVLTSIDQGFDSKSMQPARYKWELLYPDSMVHRREGYIFVKCWQERDKIRTRH